MNTSSFVILGPQRKRGASGQIKKPPVEATAWCYTGTRYGWIKRVQTPIQFTICSREDTNFSFAWTIENFGRKMENYKNGECLTSDTFKVEVEGAETAWKLECFPNGKQKIGENLIQYESNRNFSVIFLILFRRGHSWSGFSVSLSSKRKRYQQTIQLRHRICQ